MRAPRGRLRFKLAADHPRPTEVRRGRPAAWILRPNRPAYNNRALGLTPSRLPNIHLSKNSINTAANHLRFGVVISFPIAVAFGQGRRILASPPSLSIVVAKNFLSPSRLQSTPAQPPARDAFYRPHLRRHFSRRQDYRPGLVLRPNLVKVRRARLISKCCNRNKRLPAVLPAAVQSTATRPTSCGRR